jgi:acyl carrier protein
MSSNKERIVEIVSEVLELKGDEIANLRNEDDYEPIGSWDSIRHVQIMVALEDEFDLEIEDTAIPKLNNLAKIAAYIDRHRP